MVPHAITARGTYGTSKIITWNSFDQKGYIKFVNFCQSCKVRKLIEYLMDALLIAPTHTKCIAYLHQFNKYYEVLC